MTITPGQAAQTVVTYDEEIRFWVLIRILCFLGTVAFMALLNTKGYMEVNYLFAIVGGLMIFGKGFSLQAISTATAIGTIVGTTRGQPLKGASQGAAWWLTKGIPALLLVWWSTAAFLASWSFEREPFAIVPVLVFGTVILLACIVYEVIGGKTMFWIVVVYSLVAMGFALSRTNSTMMELTGQTPSAFTAKGTVWQTNPITGKRFTIEPQVGCLRARNCFDPDHGDTNGGTQLVLYSEELEQRLTATRRNSVSTLPVVISTPIQTHPTGAPTELIVPRCSEGWSETVSMFAGWSMTPAWQQSIATPNFRENGAWVPNFQNARDVDAVKYCADHILYINEEMGLTWGRS
jgi:hypothetical protein